MIADQHPLTGLIPKKSPTVDYQSQSGNFAAVGVEY